MVMNINEVGVEMDDEDDQNVAELVYDEVGWLRR